MFHPLPETIDVEPGVRKGRSPREGYQRGWGLQFGPLRPLVESETLFRSSRDRIGLPSWISPEKRANLY